MLLENSSVGGIQMMRETRGQGKVTEAYSWVVQTEDYLAWRYYGMEGRC